MQKLAIFVILVIGVAIAFLFIGSSKKTAPILEREENKEEIKSNMKITSSAFQNNTRIPSKYTCDGENVNPPLEFVDIPTNAKSLVLIVDDPDAPVGTWVHWTVFNIDPSTKKINENSKPKSGIEGMTDFGKPGYGGPCPPSGIHRYFFKLYALDESLDLSPSADKKTIEEKMQNHILEKSELVGLYSR